MTVGRREEQCCGRPRLRWVGSVWLSGWGLLPMMQCSTSAPAVQPATNSSPVRVGQSSQPRYYLVRLPCLGFEELRRRVELFETSRAARTQHRHAPVRPFSSVLFTSTPCCSAAATSSISPCRDDWTRTPHHSRQPPCTCDLCTLRWTRQQPQASPYATRRPAVRLACHHPPSGGRVLRATSPTSERDSRCG